MIGELQKHFFKLNWNVMNGVQALFFNSNSILESHLFFHSNVSPWWSESAELHQAKRTLERKRKEELLKFTVFLEPFKEVLHELFQLCKMTSAIYWWATEWLVVLNVESQRAKSLDMDKFIGPFSSQHKNHRIHRFWDRAYVWRCR